LIAILVSPARAEDPPLPLNEPRQPGSVRAPVGLPPTLAALEIQQKLGAQVDGKLTFRDESDTPVKIGDYFGDDKKPIILVLGYLRCPNLCDQTINSLLERLRPEKFPLVAGKDFTILNVSFDPREKPDLAVAKKTNYVTSYGRPGVSDGWHFLTGEEEQIKKLADMVGFGYRWEPDKNLYMHASGIMILTPDGKVSRYFLGVNYVGRDLELALVEASGNKIGTLADHFALFCFPYDGASGRYVVPVLTLIRICSVLTVLVLVVSIVRAVRQPNPEPEKVPTPK
jgi:protein SCO1/2